MTTHAHSHLYSVASGAEAPSAVPGMPLVSVLPGAIDAGRACAIATSYILDTLPHDRLVTFHSDEVIDYRATRPRVTFDGRGFRLDSEPEIAIDMVWDDAGVPFLFLSGPEPDLRWAAMARALRDLCDSFGVGKHLSLRAVPSDVPHTRMISMISHANECARADREPDAPLSDPLDLPASFSAYAEVVLERAGVPSQGFVARVPHYLARSSYPAGALALLRRLSDAVAVHVPLTDLGDAVGSSSKVIERDISTNPELGAHVRGLEEAYDAAARDGADASVTVLDTPTADEIGDSVERFLAESARPEDE